jgi:RNA polymerase sigma factor (sigma-70 family)
MREKDAVSLKQFNSETYLSTTPLCEVKSCYELGTNTYIIEYLINLVESRNYRFIVVNSIADHFGLKYGSLITKINGFDELINKAEPLAHIDHHLWSEWTDRIAGSSFASKKLSSVAKEIGLEWSYNRRDEVVSEYVNYDLEALCKMRGFGKKKLNILVLCMAKVYSDLLALGPPRGDSTMGASGAEVAVENSRLFPPSIDFEKLLRVEWPHLVVSFDEWQRWTGALRETESATRKIIEIADEIGVSWPNSRSDENLSDYINLTLTDLMKLPGLGKKKLRVLVLCTAKAFVDWQTAGHASGKNIFPAISDEPENFAAEAGRKQPEYGHQSLPEIIERCLELLSQNQREVLSLRYGLHAEDRRTLQQVADRTGVTRERIRQIQKAAIRKIKRSKFRKILLETVIRDSEEIWSELSRYRHYIPKSKSIKMMSLSITGHALVAIDCCYGSLINWLNANFRQSSGVWYSPACEPSPDHARAILE